MPLAMIRRYPYLAVLLIACTEHGMTPPGGGDDTPTVLPDAGSATCGTADETKIKFQQATGCQNDGGVEFCIPDNDPNLQASLSSISSTIRCAPGGGRAQCSITPGLLLCSYPTSFPAECESSHGAMTTATWSDMCSIAALPEVTEIVPTILE